MTNPRDFQKTHKSLLGGTAILSLAALGCGPAAGMLAANYAVDGAIAVSDFLGNVLSGMAANNVGALVEKLRSNPDILKNQDLGRATGLAIALGIRAVADGDEFPEWRDILRGLADKTVDYWLTTDSSELTGHGLSVLDESQIRYAFSANGGDYDQLRVLDEPQWKIVVRGLMQQHQKQLPAEVAEYEPAIEAIARHLNQRFASNLREVLADDAVGQQAFKKMLLDLQRETVGMLRHICDRLDEMPNKRELSAQLRELETGLQQENRQQTRLLKQILAQLQQSPLYPKPELRDAQGHRLARLYNVPHLPPKFLPRPEELAQIKQKLLGDETQKLVMTGVSQRLGVQGMGGIGKTVLAAAVARDEDVQRRFADGVMWVTLGEQPDILTRQTDLAGYLLGNRPYFEDIPQGKAELRQLLADKACLLIVDDVWQMAHAAAFDVLGPQCQLLLTTRDAELISGFGAQGHEVELLTNTQALGLLAQWAGEHLETLPPDAADVARECGYLPLAVAISGAMVAGKGATRWQNVLHKLQTADLEKLHQDFPDYPYPDLFKAIQVSIEALPPKVAERYLDFAIFPEDTSIPEGVLVGFWAREGVTEYDVQDVLDTLVQRSLAFRDSQGRITLHDLQLDYVRKQAGDISQVQERFLNSYRQRYPQGFHTVEDDGYFFQHLIRHHLQHQPEEIRQLLLDFPWLQAKLEATDVKALLLDFESVSGGDEAQEALRLLESAIQMSAHILGEDKRQLISQLWGRLLSFVSPPAVERSEYRYFWEKLPLVGPYLPNYSQTPVDKRGRLLFSPLFQGKPGQSEPSEEDIGELAAVTVPEIETLLTQAKNYQANSWFRPLSPSLTPAGGALLRTLTGHSSWVRAVAITPDGKQAVSASGDKTLKLWDLATGEELATLTGHSSPVYAVAITPDGKQAVSASKDNTLKLWDLATGEELTALTGHSKSIRAVAITPDGKQAVSASRDKTLKLWDLVTGEELTALTGHSNWVEAVAITPDGKQAVSASKDKTLKLWDLATGEELAALTGHSHGVEAVAITPDGKQAVSASRDKTLKLWDLVTGEELATSTGHSSWVEAVAITPDGKQAVSASVDQTLKLWDLTTGEERATPTGHRDWVEAVAITPDGQQVVSASSDQTLKLWDLTTGEELATLTGHRDWVEAVAISPDGKQAVSASVDQTLKLWDLTTGEELATLTGHRSWVLAVAITPDGKQAVSASNDQTLKLWDLTTGEELATLTGHRDRVEAVAITPDGQQAVSASNDQTLKLWDLTTGEELANLIGHSRLVTAVAITPDGQQAVSASNDQTLKLWDLTTGEELATLTGHRDRVKAVAINPDGKQAVSASVDQTLKLWDLTTGDIIASFGGDGALRCCAIAPDGVTVVAGESSGRVHCLRLEGLQMWGEREP